MSPHTTPTYRYSNTKFWLLIATCVLVLCGSTGYHIVAIRAADATARQTFAQAVRVALNAAETRLVAQHRDGLRLLAESTIGKLRYFAVNDPPALHRWLDEMLQRHLSRSPDIRAIALYDIRADRHYLLGATDCLDTIVEFDGVCIERNLPAVRLTVPVYSHTYARIGWMSASIVVTPSLLAHIEHDFGFRLRVTYGERLLYASASMPSIMTPPNLRITPPMMLADVLAPLPQHLLTSSGLWYQYTLEIGRPSDPSPLVFRAVRPANWLFWKIVEAVGINLLLLLATVILFSFFHINYRYISHTYRAVIDGMDDFLAFKDSGRKYQIINMKMAQMLFDRHPKEVVGYTDAELGLSQEMRDQCADSDQVVITTRERVRLIEHGMTAAGRFVVLDVLKTPMIRESGRFDGVIICGRDISEQAELQATLDELEESYFSSEWILAKLFQTMPEFLYVKDVQHRFIRASFSICEFYGYSDVTGLTDFDLLQPEEAKTCWQAEERVLTGMMESYTEQESVTLPDGRRRHILTTKTVFRDKAGKIAGLLGIGRDVTEMMDKQTAFEFVIAQMTQQTLQQVEKQKQKTEKFQIEADHV